MNWQLKINGMSCAACAVRLQKVLNRKDGVEAEVSFAAENAFVESRDLGLDEILAIIRKAGFEASETRAVASPSAPSLSRREFAGLAAGMVVLVFDMGGMLLGLMNPLGVATSAVLSTLCQFTVGGPFLKKALGGIRQGSFGMDVLISLGTLSAWILSMGIFSGLVKGHHVWFEASSSVLVLVRLGKILEERARHHSFQVMSMLGRELPDRAMRIVDGKVEEVDSTSLVKGERFQVLPHENIPCDGKVLEGSGEVDEALFTGESEPVLKTTGDEVFAGSRNLGSRLVVEVLQIRGNTCFDQVISAVEKAQASRAPVQDLADAVSQWFVPLVILIAALAGSWVGVHGGSLEDILVRFITVLVVSCPCALGLATPTAIMAGIGRGAELGLLIREARSLQKAENLKTFCLDKTGTLTEGKPRVERLISVNGFQEEEILLVAASLESSSRHPLALAIQDFFTGEMQIPEQVEVITGSGIHGTVLGRSARIGKPGYVLPDSEEIPEDVSRYSGSVVVLAIGEKTAGYFLIADGLKKDAFEAVSRLKSLGLEPVLLSGDREAPVREVARQCGIEKFYFQVSPQEKQARILEFQKNGGVGMMGDGINDALALTQADFSVAMGEGSAAARASADLSLMDGGVGKVVAALELSKRTMRTIRRNLWFAFLYNLIAIPLACSGQLHPGIAGGLMALSSVLVVMSSLSLRAFWPKEKRE